MATSILTTFQKQVLDAVSKDISLSNQFYFTGGTALTEFHLHHRLSEDLDFFNQEEFNIAPIQSFIKRLMDSLAVEKMEYRNQLGLHTFFLRKNSNPLKIDFSYYPFPLIERGLQYNLMQIDSMRDIAVNKLQTIATNPRSRDFIDLYCIIEKTGWTIDELRKQAINKFDSYVDSLQLGANMLLVREKKDYPHMLIPFDFKLCEIFWMKEAEKLKKEILK